MSDGRDYLASMFGLSGKSALVTGGTGVLGNAIAKALADAGARVAVLGRRRAADQEMSLQADVRDRGSLAAAREQLMDRWGELHILVNAAGGNTSQAVVPEGGDVFAMSESAFRDVLDLNLLGTLLPTLEFGAAIARSGGGSIVNISSMSAGPALTRVGGYGAAKAAVENLTRWLAVELGRRHGAAIRVNAIAPGFFVGEQNRALLYEPDGTLTSRGQAIIKHTPSGRFGIPDDLASTVIWLCGPGSRFVNGVVVPIDGGFSAYSGI
ncbi:MAG TPA: SDR family oxidoreductase [Candidatus Dormibacteraeota bacterium]|nr:SDR family oxidoreductase [Candidatus Dormibacteraeota bacterium]